MRAFRAISPLAILMILAILLLCAYAVLAALSFRFAPGSEPTERPILAVLGLFGLAFLCYLIAIRVALKVKEGTRLLTAILLTSILIRAVSLVSWPILEIDIYRYIWDGAVTLEGTSPYRYSPEQVLSGRPNGQLPADLRRLVELRDGKTALGTILSRIHYSELPTIYPPVSQAVFALSLLVTPAEAGVFGHVLVMKAMLVLFDLATVLVVIGLLRLAGKHIGWAVAYAWCPLVIKEVANTGHLDSLAVLLTTLALYFAVKPLACGREKGDRHLLPERPEGCFAQKVPVPFFPRHAVVAAVLLALAVGAKLYAVVLAPLFVLIWIRSRGWRPATAATSIFLATTAIVLWPMLPGDGPHFHGRAPSRSDGRRENGTVPLGPHAREKGDRHLLPERPEGCFAQKVPAPLSPPPPVPVDTADVKPQDPSGGLKAFLRRWEMNDFLFMLVAENLKPTAGVEPARRAWFSIVPENWKALILSVLPSRLEVSDSQAAFLIARLITAAVFVLIGGISLWKARGSGDPAVWLRVAFLTLAWLWLLSPTQNPWYWTWALPLVMFAGSRAWLAVSGLVMIYYLRFWLSYHWPEQPLLGTPYPGAAFFDFVVTWVEFGPWLLWLTWGARRRTTSGRAALDGDLLHRRSTARRKNPRKGLPADAGLDSEG